MSWGFYNKEGKLLYDVVPGASGNASELGGIPPSGYVRIGSPGQNLGNVDLTGSLTLPVVQTSVNLPLTAAHRTILVDTTSGAVNLTLPSSPLTGQTYEVKDTGNSGAGNASTNNISITPDPADRIDGAPVGVPLILNQNGQGVALVFDGTNWVTMADKVDLSAINATQLGGLTASQFLRSDAPDTAAGVITFSDTTNFSKSVYGPVTNVVASNITLTADHKTVLVDTGGVTRTISLSAGVAGQWYEIVDAGNSASVAQPIVIDPAGAATIDGAAVSNIDIAGNAVIIVCDGTNWFTVAQRLAPAVVSTPLDGLSDVNTATAGEGHLLRYNTPIGEWQNTPKVTVDDTHRLNLAASGSGTGISIGSDAGPGNDVTLHLQTNKSLKITGRTMHAGTENSSVLVIENGTLPAVGDSYKVVLPTDNVILANTLVGDMFIVVPSALNASPPLDGDKLKIKDADGGAGTNTLALVAEGVRKRNVPLLTLDTPVGVSDATSLVTSGGVGVDEVQNFMVTGSGTYNINFDGAITGGLTELSTAAQVQTAINALSPHPTYGYFSVSVTGTDALGGLNVTFNGGALIDGEAYVYMVVPYQGSTLVASSGNWFLI